MSIFNSSSEIILQIKSSAMTALFLFTFYTCYVIQKSQTCSLITSCVKNFDELLYTIFEVVTTLTMLQDTKTSISLITSSDQFDNACLTACQYSEYFSSFVHFNEKSCILMQTSNVFSMSLNSNFQFSWILWCSFCCKIESSILLW